MGDAKRCCHCGKPTLVQRFHGMPVMRAWCRPCLRRIEYHGIVDFDEYPTDVEGRRAGAPRTVDVF